MSKLWIKLNTVNPVNPDRAIEVDVGDFFLAFDAVLENREEGYKIPIGQVAICVDCGATLKQTWADSMGKGGLECNCSSWECPISPMSGTAYIQSKLKRVRHFTDVERAEMALRTYGLDTRLLKDK